MLATRFIIALCPANKIYLASVDPVFREGMNLGQATVGVPTLATQFNTFEAAMDVCKGITGWGGAQRVEQVAVEVEDTRQTLDTPEARIEVRDNATAQYNAAIEAGYAERNAAEEVAKELRSLGIKVGVDYRDGASCTVSLHLADHLGNLLTLDWDPMQDGFSYETEGDDACDIGETEAQHEAEPCPDADPDCECCGGTGVRITHHFGNSLHGGSTSDCECTWRDSTGDDDGIPCDGCGATDAEPCGDSEGFSFCAACRKPDAPKAADPVTFDPAWIDGILGRDDLTFDQTPLTPEQEKHARTALSAALRRLVLDNALSLASSALTEARDNT